MNIHIVIWIYIDYFVVMDPSRATYANYYSAKMETSLGTGLVSGAIATAVTYPIEYVKTVSQFQSNAIGFRGNRWKGN